MSARFVFVLSCHQGVGRAAYEQWHAAINSDEFQQFGGVIEETVSREQHSKRHSGGVQAAPQRLNPPAQADFVPPSSPVGNHSVRVLHGETVDANWVRANLP